MDDVQEQDGLDHGGQSVTTIEVCGESLVASRHTILWTESNDSYKDSYSQAAKQFTRGSIFVGPVLRHHPALISCFRVLTLSILPEGDKIVFACEIRSGTEDKCFFVIISSKRGIDPAVEESMILIVSHKQVEEEMDGWNLLLGIPILSTLSIEFRGRGVFGVSLATNNKRTDPLYFETQSLHSMWAAIVSLEKARDAAKAANLFGIESHLRWMADYFSEESAASTQKFSTSEADGTEDDPEAEGEGGRAIIIHPRSTTSGSFSAFSSQTANVGIWEAEPGLGSRMFALSALKRVANRSSISISVPDVALNRPYIKPEVGQVNAAIFSFVSSASDPDDLSVSDVIDHLKMTFGSPIIGKQGYSSAMIDGLIYTIVGQMEPPSMILDGLYLGSEYNAANKAELKALGITHVLNVTVEVNKFFPDDLVYHQVCILDTPNAQILPYFERGIEFIENALGNDGTGCLVHCQRGVSRSASFVIAYIMKTRNMNTEDAIKFVKERRKIVKPNTGFVAQLKQWQKQNGIN